MNEDVIADIEHMYREQAEYILHAQEDRREFYYTQWLDGVQSMADIIKKHTPSYDIGEFYVNCGHRMLAQSRAMVMQ